MSKSVPETTSSKEGWQRKANAWKWERPAQITLLLSIASALGALFSWCMFLDGNDVRRNPLFWLMAAPLMVWFGAVQGTKKWAVTSLPAALVLWPAASLLAWLVEHHQRTLGTVYRLATPLTMELTFSFTMLTAVGAFAVLRRSSLPGGRQTVQPRDASYRPKGALPPADPELLAVTKALLGSMLSWIFVGIVSFVASAELNPDFDRVFRTTFLPLLGMIPLVVGCFAWGAVQSRRNPGRPAPAYLGMLLLQSLFCVMSVVNLVLGFGRTDHMLSGSALLALIGALVQLTVAAYTWWMMRERSARMMQKTML